MKLPSLEAVQLELLRRKTELSLHDFVQHIAWPALTPGIPFQDNWHIHAICEHLEALQRGEIRKLLINMPFRMLKSTIVSQAFPAWDWLANAWRQYLTASYAKDIATRDAVASRRIIESDLYQSLWADRFEMTSDQNVKTRYENSMGGARTVTATDASATGFGGNFRIVDDPISSKEANSSLAIETAIEWWRGTIATRGNDPATDRVVVVHQRVNAQDLTGYLLAEELGWEHLVLPMRYDPALTKTTSLGFVDPRTEPGELLHPDRLNEETVKSLEASLGSYHVASQLQQAPVVRGGNLIKGQQFVRYSVPGRIKHRYVFADTAQKTAERNDYSVFECWGLGWDGKIYLLDLIRGKWEAPELKRRAIDFWHKQKAADINEFGQVRKVFIEDKSSGTGLIQEIRAAAIFPVSGIERVKDKYTRVSDILGYIESGHVCIPESAPWVNDFIAECEAFTADDSHPHDDQIDPMVDAINEMLAVSSTLAIWQKLGR